MLLEDFVSEASKVFPLIIGWYYNYSFQGFSLCFIFKSFLRT